MAPPVLRRGDRATWPTGSSRFAVGDRVRMTGAYGHVHPHAQTGAVFTVVGFMRHEPAVYVKRANGNRRADAILESYLELAT